MIRGIRKYVPDVVLRLAETNVRRTTLPEAAARLGVPLVSLADCFPRTVFSSPIQVLRGSEIPNLPAALRSAPLPPMTSTAATSTTFNEIAPSNARDILAAAPPGVYLAVGADRAYLGFVQAPQTHGYGLVVVDRDPGVIRFHRINIALLRAANDRAHYVHLRLHADDTEWKMAAWRRGLDVEEASLLTSGQWRWWREAVRTLEMFATFHQGFARRALEAVATKDIRPHYLLEDAPFAIIHQAACAGRLVAHPCDLAKPTERQALATALQQQKLPVSVGDFSNLHNEKHLGHNTKHHFCELVGNADDAILLLTNVVRTTPTAYWHQYLLNYSGVTASCLRTGSIDFQYLPFDNTLHRDPERLATQMDVVREERRTRLLSGSQWDQHLRGLR